METSLVLEKAVEGMCVRLASADRPMRRLPEQELWTRLFECVLSSQVPYYSAQIAAHRVTKIIFDFPTEDQLSLEKRLMQHLNEPMSFGNRTFRYRFPNSKARQVAKTWCRFRDCSKPIARWVYAPRPEEELRTALVRLVTGMGYKQASMFLRDIGVAQNLAIIDRHVLDYMKALSLVGSVPNVLSVAFYRKCENALADYTAFLGYPMALVDRAIWLVIRVAKHEALI